MESLQPALTWQGRPCDHPRPLLEPYPFMGRADAFGFWVWRRVAMEKTPQRLQFGIGVSLAAAILTISVGCRSPYYADQGALAGGLTGAGVGALVGDAVGDTAAGAAIGAGVGTLTGAMVGNSLDEIEARNRAAINAQLATPLRPGAVTVEDVIAMNRGGVSETLMASHVQYHGVANPLTAADLIMLQQESVPESVVAAMQRPAAPARVATAPPVVVEEHYLGPPPYLYPPPVYRGYHGHWHHHCPPRAAFGVSVIR